MVMKPIESNLPCPSCSQPLQPLVLGCGACGIRVEGQFTLNEFASLPAADLHFLRIWVHCEGRVKDMEAALGLSYPTIRNRMAELKTKIASAVAVPHRSDSKENRNETILRDLAEGKISFEESMKRIRGEG